MHPGSGEGAGGFEGWLRSLVGRSGYENGPVLTSLRAVASSVGPAPNDRHHRATPHAPHETGTQSYRLRTSKTTSRGKNPS
jgi:hypothetical protein